MLRIAPAAALLIATIGSAATAPTKEPNRDRAPVPASDLAGIWESAETSSGGIGQVLEFTNDGRLIQTMAIMPNGYYRVIGDRLVLDDQPPKPDADTSASARIAIDGGTLLETNPDGSTRRLERFGQTPKSATAIVGTWIDRANAAPMYERFGEDGRYARRMPMATTTDRYQRADKDLTVTSAGRTTTLSVEVRGDGLFLQRSGERRPHEFRRVAELWYDRDVENIGAKRRVDPKQRLAKADADLVRAVGETSRFDALPDAALLNADVGSPEKASALADELLRTAEKYRGDWNYGNAIHKANLALGLVALRAGNISEAKSRLLAAGKTPGSAQLDSFGPNMVLARELLAKGERDAVVEYFGLCAKFWKMDSGKLAEWTSQVRNGQLPDFGANLLY